MQATPFAYSTVLAFIESLRGAHLTNAHALPGDGIVNGLRAVGGQQGRGLLLLAELSSKGSLATGAYTEACVAMARRHADFVVGFIAQRRVHDGDSHAITNGATPEHHLPHARSQHPHLQSAVTLPDGGEDFLILAPGVGLDVKGDAVGQQYRTPDEVIRRSGCDVAIVGRGMSVCFLVLMTCYFQLTRVPIVTAVVKVDRRTKSCTSANDIELRLGGAYLARIGKA